MKKQVFVLELMDSQKSTWQGVLRWVQEQKECPFRSTLEMLRLIDSVIGNADVQWTDDGSGETEEAAAKGGWE